jgi:hypothetical protein
MINELIVWKICNAHPIVSIKAVIIPLLLILLIVSALTLIARLISTVSGARCAARRHGGWMQVTGGESPSRNHFKWRL